jgi:hypothetical protein
VPTFWRGVPYPEDGGKRDKMKVDTWTLLVLNVGEIGNTYIRKFCLEILKGRH